MNFKKIQILALLACSFFTFACVYIVLPEGSEAPEVVEGSEFKVWNAVVTNVGKSEAGDVHIDITIRNDTGDWSTMYTQAKVKKEQARSVRICIFLKFIFPSPK